VRFCCLGSGSKGNASLVSYKNTLLMVDCGFSMREVFSRLEDAQCAPEQLTALLVTHEHADHISGVAVLARKLSLPVYATRGTAKTGKLDSVADVRWISLDEEFQIGDISIMPVAVPHDAHEPCQYVFSAAGRQLGIITDLGSISEHVQQAFNDCHALLLEANHDAEMLWQGAYPESLKRRVASDWGHLNNQQAEDFLHSINQEKLTTLVLGHISEKNNCLTRVKQHFQQFAQPQRQVTYATQDSGFDWLDV